MYLFNLIPSTGGKNMRYTEAIYAFFFFKINFELGDTFTCIQLSIISLPIKLVKSLLLTTDKKIN